MLHAQKCVSCPAALASFLGFKPFHQEEQSGQAESLSNPIEGCGENGIRKDRKGKLLAPSSVPSGRRKLNPSRTFPEYLLVGCLGLFILDIAWKTPSKNRNYSLQTPIGKTKTKTSTSPNISQDARPAQPGRMKVRMKREKPRPIIAPTRLTCLAGCNA